MAETTEKRGRAKHWRWVVVALASLLALLVIVLFVFRSLYSPTSTPVVPIADVSSERLLGLGSTVGFAAEHDTHAWLGIPFAQPPVGDRRWRAPEPPEAWADTLDALRVGPPCVQLGSRLGGVPSEDPDGLAGSEDCLYLNVWAPRSEPEGVAVEDARYPVMVWVHGGGNRTGHSGSTMYDGARLSGREKVVVVSFNYRLGPFGWFSHPALRASAANALEASGNFGTLDQIRALEWIQSHIAEFGGDPDNVTLFGESAGASDVFALLLADSAKGLFDRAIAQSGSTDSVSVAEAENEVSAPTPGHRHSSAEIMVSLLEDAGIVPDREAARGYAAALPNADTLEFLRSRSARDIIDVYRNPDRPSAIDVPTLIRDGSLLPNRDWIGEFRSGRWNRVPIMLGSNRDEMKLFLFQNPELVRQNFGLVYRIRDLADYERRARYHSELWAVRSVSKPASAISDSGFADLYAYRFDWDEAPHLLGTDLSTLLGAAHGFEIPFVFGNFDLGDPLFSRIIFPADSAATRERLSNRMMSYWAEFARTGRPGRGGDEQQPEWQPWAHNGDGEPKTATIVVFDTESDGGIRLAQTGVSRDHVIAAVDADPSLGQDEKCELFRDLFANRPDWNLEEYRGIGRQGCADYPAERHD